MLGYEYIAEFFRQNGVSHVFYQEAVLRVLMREIEKDPKAATKFILTHSEGAAGYMADGYARAAGRPGVCMAQSIGAGNMVGAVYDAFLANSPVLAVTGKKDPDFQYKNCYQETDHRLLYEAVTKFNAEAQSGSQIPFLFRNAFQAMTTGKARPAHIDLTDHQAHTAEMAETGETAFSCNLQYSHYPAYRPAAPEEKIAEAVKAICDAERPLIVAGRGASVSGAGEELCAFAKKADIPVVMSPDGKCLMDETDPLWSGIVGAYGMDCANRAACAADLVIFIGTQTADQTTFDWNCPPKSTKCIQIDIDASELGKNYVNTVGLPGDAKTVLGQLVNAVPGLTHADWRKEVTGYVQATLSEYQARIDRPSEVILPERLCDEVAKALPDDAVMVSDTGYSAVWSATMMRMKKTQKYFRAAGSLGWAFPASLGVKCALPERPVFCFAGDGAMYYHLPEFETAHRYGIKTITIINHNNMLAQSSSGLMVVHKDTPDHGASHFAFSGPDFTKIAEGFGLDAVRVTKAEDIGPAIRKAMEAKSGTVIEVLTDGSSLTPPARH